VAGESRGGESNRGERGFGLTSVRKGGVQPTQQPAFHRVSQLKKKEEGVGVRRKPTIKKPVRPGEEGKKVNKVEKVISLSGGFIARKDRMTPNKGVGAGQLKNQQNLTVVEKKEEKGGIRKSSDIQRHSPGAE